MKQMALVSFLTLLALMPACWRVGSHEESAAPDVDADTDTDVDSDGDTDADTDTDGDTDTDVDTGSETGFATDTDSGTSSDCACSTVDDCCDGCEPYPAGTQCESDSDPMTVDTCDGAGECEPGESYCTTFSCWQVEPTGEDACYNDSSEIECTSFPCEEDGSPDYCGQDAQYDDNERTFTCYDAFGDIQDPCDGWADEDEVVEDSLTGLTWQRTWADGLNWQEAQDYCEITLNDLSYAGYGDWRLPGPHELAGIVYFGTASPAIDTEAFVGTPSTLSCAMKAGK